MSNDTPELITKEYIESILAKYKDRWHYEYDTFLGQRMGVWRFPCKSSGDTYYGDCEDTALFLGVKIYGSKSEFLKALKDGRASIIQVGPPTNGTKSWTHAMLVIEELNLVIDNNFRVYHIPPSKHSVVTYRKYRYLKTYSYTAVVTKLIQGFVLDVLQLYHLRVKLK